MSLDSVGEQRLAERVVRRMLERDAFSAWLGLELLEVRPRYAAVRMVVRPDMMNGFGVCHGGVTFALADSAFAFASNTHGRVTVSIDNTITYPAAVVAGDVLTAVATEEGAADRIAFYGVRVTNQDGGVVALFRGTVYRTNRGHLEEQDGG
ncbi:MAG: hydroxyphenylacetyl-CoA thioesterase PaaI [Gemmatimonadota bacterium]|nr:hydroxyphenylacetyl-CoA thioesterase PaaI [Gemmatimonadota bacterium]